MMDTLLFHEDVPGTTFQHCFNMSTPSSYCFILFFSCSFLDNLRIPVFRYDFWWYCILMVTRMEQPRIIIIIIVPWLLMACMFFSISWVLRHLGGFFIKRKLDHSSGKDELYKCLLQEVWVLSLVHGWLIACLATIISKQWKTKWRNNSIYFLVLATLFQSPFKLLPVLFLSFELSNGASLLFLMIMVSLFYPKVTHRPLS